jgi:hypothetical protein
MPGKNLKYWKRRFGNRTDGDQGPYHHHLDYRGISDLNDEGLQYLMTNIRGVNMLDLNDTEISNESIRFLTGLEYVNELRLKECRIDNDCVPDLNKLVSLEFLHVKDTRITLDGLLQLTALKNLKRLLFSAEETESIQEKMEQLSLMLPDCEFTINGKPY